MTQDSYELKVGSRYCIRFSEDLDYSGTFQGYTMIGTESAVVMKDDRDKIRFIPVAQISYIDLLVSVQEPERRSQPEHLYG